MAGNLNSGRSYLITAVNVFTIFFLVNAEVGASVRVPGETPDASPIKSITKGPLVSIKSLHSVVQDTVLLEYTNGVLGFDFVL